ncbi:MAG TPA: glycine dehydrogenase, partial [Anaeromyxobacteraceae bacterium]|nr:glycine dehydrogenase [Anaeromyxobacteraceae bacterium]
MRYHPHTPDDVRAMLDAVGVKSVADLFRSIPEPLRLRRPLAVEPPLDEIALLAEARRLASRNAVDHPPFAGAGCYPHHVPPAVDQLLLRGEFFTAYTPYQPEISQGTLQALFEWQTFVCLLTGMDVSNASMYDGATATAEAALMATRATGRKKIVVTAAL